MEKQYKTFNDLRFNEWAKGKNEAVLNNPLFRQYSGHKQAVLNFPNGYGVSVLFGSSFYSDGVSSYEVAVIKNGSGVVYPPEICPDNDVLGYQTKEQVTEIMKKVQDL